MSKNEREFFVLFGKIYFLHKLKIDFLNIYYTKYK